MEIEVKIPLGKDRPERIKRFFEEELFMTQENWVFFSDDKTLRVRSEGRRVFITIKGANEGNSFNSREEAEISFLGNHLEIISAFEKIFGRAKYYVRKRAEKTFKKSKVSLDVFGNGNNYVEIEGTEKQIPLALEELGLSILQNERRPYYEIESDC